VQMHLINRHYDVCVAAKLGEKSARIWVMHGCLVNRRMSTFGLWEAPAAPKTLPNGGELCPPQFGMVFGVAQTPKIDDLRSTKKQPSQVRP
jgi:hypothetical protein